MRWVREGGGEISTTNLVVLVEEGFDSVHDESF